MNKKLFEFIKNSPTAFHAVNETALRLVSDCYTELYENEVWKLREGGKYFVRRGGSSLIAFRIPNGGAAAFMITASHCDSPSFKIKENAELEGSGVTRLSCEKYGEMLCASWFDRPLSVAGRVCVRTKRGMEVRLAAVDAPVIIPSVAIHMNRNANNGAVYNAAQDMLPVFCSGASNGEFKKNVAEAVNCKADDILSTDLFLYNPQCGVESGGLIMSPRLDDLQCAFAALEAFVQSGEGASVPVFSLFNNEEVGSTTKQGAASTFLDDVLFRIFCSFGKGREDYIAALADSFMVSCDNAHAVHPAHPELSDKNHSVYMNGGVVIKFNANQKYTSDGVSYGLFRLVCEEAGVPVQLYANRADMPGGSTLGNISNTQVSLNAVDIGLAQLAMHSAMETAGAADPEYMSKALKLFYEKSLKAAQDAYYLL